MSLAYPPEIAKFVEEELESGRYTDESALLSEALAVFRELKRRHTDLVQEIERSLEDERTGRTSAFDIEEIIAEFESEVDETGQPIP